MVFDASRGQYLETLKAGETSVSSISFNADGTLMTSVSEDRIQVWHTDGFRERNRFSVGRGQTAAMSPDGSVVAVGTTGSRNYPGKVALTLHDAKTGKEMVDFGCLKSGSLLQFTPDGRYLIQGLGGLLVVYDAKSGKQLSVTDGPTFQSMVLVPNTKLLATGNQSGSLWLWKVGAE
jgi:WD40 repeat protein